MTGPHLTSGWRCAEYLLTPEDTLGSNIKDDIWKMYRGSIQSNGVVS